MRIPGDATIWTPYCGTGPGPGEWLSRWNFDPLLLIAMAVVGVLYARMQPAHGAGRRGAAAGAFGLFAFLFVSPFCALGSSLFLARVVHHVLLAEVLAPLIVLAVGLQFRRLPGSLLVWTALQALVFWAWHAPPLYAAALSNDAIFWAMQLSILSSSAVWWAKLLRAPAAGAVAALLAAMVLMGLLGALITFAGAPLYAPHYLTTAAWGFSPLEDQQLGGLTMWAPAAAIYLFTALTLLYRSMRPDAAEPAA